MTLPNFLIIGAPRAGTTSLYHYLRQHPDVYMSPLKEGRYFWFEGQPEGHPFTRNRASYERLFVAATSQRAVGEASPQYLGSTTGAERIAADIPSARLIVSLRNPADRAYSSYLFRRRNGTERGTMEEALRPGTYHFDTGLYHQRLVRYFARFARDRIKVLLFDDLVTDPRAVLRELHRFLEIDPDFATDVSERHNRALVPRSRLANAIVLRTTTAIHRLLPAALHDTGLGTRLQRLVLRPPAPLPPAVRHRLLAGFRDDILTTGALLGRDLSHWLE